MIDRAHQSASSNAGTRPAAAGSIAGAPRRLAGDQRSSKQTGRGAISQRARSMSTSSPDPPRASKYVMQFDGGSRGNPGPSGAGAVLYRWANLRGRNVRAVSCSSRFPTVFSGVWSKLMVEEAATQVCCAAKQQQLL